MNLISLSFCGLDYFFTILKILQVINETYHGVQVINFTNPIILYFHQYFQLRYLLYSLYAIYEYRKFFEWDFIVISTIFHCQPIPKDIYSI